MSRAGAAPYNGVAGDGEPGGGARAGRPAGVRPIPLGRGGVEMGIVVVRSPKCLRGLLRRIFGMK